MIKIYLVTYNTNGNFNQAIFHAYLTSLYPLNISDWWHHIDTTYLVASTLNVNQLYNLIYPGVPQRNLLIIEVDPNNTQGWLPPLAWEWIKKYKH
jgi:hypothetical protein